MTVKHTLRRAAARRSVNADHKPKKPQGWTAPARVAMRVRHPESGRMQRREDIDWWAGHLSDKAKRRNRAHRKNPADRIAWNLGAGDANNPHSHWFLWEPSY